jgi:hypothetical protein
MAGKEVQKKQVEVGGEKDSFSQPLEEAQPVFMTGHPAAGGKETEEELLERQLKEKAEKEKGEKPPEKKATEKKEEEKEEIPEDRQERISKSEEKESEEEVEKPRKPKFDTLEDADKALQEAERKMHLATTEAAENRRLLSSLQDQMNTLLLSQVEGKKEKEKAERELKSKEGQDATRKALKDMLKVVRSLDPEADDYDDRYAEAQETFFRIREDQLRSSLKEELKGEIVKEVKPTDNKEKELWNTAVRFAKAKGLDMNPEVDMDDDGNPIPSTDYELFEASIYAAPGKTLKEQVENAVKKVNRIKGKIQEPLLKARKKDDSREKETETEILERGGRESTERVNKPVKSMSLTDVLNDTQRIL